jgi:antitoxin Phd
MPRTRATKPSSAWALQDAKNRLSEVVDAALGGEPQVVTRRGVPTAVVISFDDYERMSQIQRGRRPSLSQYLISGPALSGEPFDRIRLRPRDEV